jgi:hypothetical protein
MLLRCDILLHNLQEASEISSEIPNDFDLTKLAAIKGNPFRSQVAQFSK